jgi:hypothetical protein
MFKPGVGDIGPQQMYLGETCEFFQVLDARIGNLVVAEVKDIDVFQLSQVSEFSINLRGGVSTSRTAPEQSRSSTGSAPPLV